MADDPHLGKRRDHLNARLAVAPLDAFAFKARCYSAMAQMLGTRSVTERLHRLLIFLLRIHGIRKGQTPDRAEEEPATDRSRTSRHGGRHLGQSHGTGNR
ncbi:hypothetical protein [Bradyrhizobium sp. AUGA SZCCT0160]|uniref:hypothetical protein n=1 Tax=Bradyrhizobium sp. AUGA SZCCT0160 TaxID=2807662 RepID=UPI00390C83F1